RDLGATPRTKFYLVHLPATATLREMVHLAHQRWAIEQQYQELKDELGLDSLRGPLVARLGTPRRADRTGLQLLARRTPSAPADAADAPARAGRDAGCVDSAFLCHAAAVSQVDAQAQRRQSTDLAKVTM